ncbi:MAG: glycosyltransferase family 4 protein, partial [Phycisphaeraceae bacterium JB051]
MTHSPHTDRSRLKVAMMQDGSRRAYALPIALHKANALEVMYTDWYDRPGSLDHLLATLFSPLMPAAVSKLRTRKSDDLADAPICSWPITTLRNRRLSKKYDSEAQFFLEVAKRDRALINKHNFHGANMLLGCIRNLHPDLIADAHAKGIITVGDQIIAPAAEEIEQAKRQTQRWPDWQPDVIEKNVRAFVDFEQQSWANLDHILSMSEYVKQSLIKHGVDENRITLLPYPMDMSAYNPPDRSTRPNDRPIRVGFVGAINLRKGAPEFLETAKRFDKRQAEFVMVGANHLNPDKLAAYQDHVTFTGKLPLTKVREKLGEFDIFFFPTTCEGSAGSVLEAMAMGLPIVTTLNAGSQVRDGKEGLIVSCGDLPGYHEAISKLIAEPHTRLAMGNAARERAMTFDMTWYQD